MLLVHFLFTLGFEVHNRVVVRDLSLVFIFEFNSSLMID